MKALNECRRYYPVVCAMLVDLHYSYTLICKLSVSSLEQIRICLNLSINHIYVEQ
jgi:hypothetical protein